MAKTIRKLLLAPAACLWVAGATAQSIGPSTINAAGGSATVGGNTHEWSIGEMTIVSTNTAGSVTVTHGVLQPFKSSTLVNDPAFASLLNVFPNPAQSILSIRHSDLGTGAIAYALTDATGKIVARRSEPLAGPATHTLNIEPLAAGVYLLSIEAGSRKAAFTITKAR